MNQQQRQHVVQQLANAKYELEIKIDEQFPVPKDGTRDQITEFSKDALRAAFAPGKKFALSKEDKARMLNSVAQELPSLVGQILDGMPNSITLTESDSNAIVQYGVAGYRSGVRFAESICQRLTEVHCEISAYSQVVREQFSTIHSAVLQQRKDAKAKLAIKHQDALDDIMLGDNEDVLIALRGFRATQIGDLS